MDNVHFFYFNILKTYGRGYRICLPLNQELFLAFCNPKPNPKPKFNPCPAEPGYTLPIKKPTDLDLHCLPLSM